MECSCAREVGLLCLSSRLLVLKPCLSPVSQVLSKVCEPSVCSLPHSGSHHIEVHNSHHMSAAGIGVQAEPGNLDRMCCGSLCEKGVRMSIYTSFGKCNEFGEGLKEEFCI